MKEKRPLIAGFYSYMWMREDESPYYVGKGSGKRAFINGHGVHRPPCLFRIVVFPQDSEADAFRSEMDLIELFGRKDLGTGCLRNLTNGGEGTTGHKHTLKAKKAISVSLLGNSRGLGQISRLGQKASAESRRKQSEKKIGNHNGFGNPIFAALQAERQRGQRRDPEVNRKTWDTRFIQTVAWG